MKLLKAIFQNALLLATIVTITAGAILVVYGDRPPADASKAQGASLQPDEGVPPNLIAAAGGRKGAASSREADEGRPPGMAS
jgi:hypothetical protein